MARGAPVIFVDFVDYDEVAHHAGPSRPESMRTLESLDRVLQFFDDLADEVRRDYELVVVSDHGQAQGMTFRQLNGRTLSDLVHDLAALPVRPGDDDKPAELWGPVNNLLTSASRSDRLVGAAVRNAVRRREGSRDPEAAPETGSLVVAASGSLAHIYLTDETGRVTLETIDERFQGLLPGLAANPHIGAVVVRRDDGTLAAIGSEGWREIVVGVAQGGEGVDPLAAYGPHAAADVAALDLRQHVGDLVVLGRFDPSLGEVVAFEELVGSHGGLGGGQTDALLIHPASWQMPDAEPLAGLDVHRILLRRLDQLGLRNGKSP